MSLNDVGIYLGDGLFLSDIGIVNLHPSKGTHWMLYVHENFFHSYGCSPPQKRSKFIIKRNRHCLHSEYKIQAVTIKKDFHWASYCLYINYVTKVIGIDIKSAVLNLYYQMIQ